jgi:hypothetical protein
MGLYQIEQQAGISSLEGLLSVAENPVEVETE